MKNELITCRCDRYGDPCRNPATQEDLLCDDCRGRSCWWMAIERQEATHFLPAWNLLPVSTPG
jgi:hypothetical protein